jgi:hypothetical protein
VTSAGNRAPPGPKEDPGPITARRDEKKRSGSRFLLAVALAGGVIGAFLAGAHISDFLCDITGVTSISVRLGVKVASIALALPAGFYLVERFFLHRAKQGRVDESS